MHALLHVMALHLEYGQASCDWAARARAGVLRLTLHSPYPKLKLTSSLLIERLSLMRSLPTSQLNIIDMGNVGLN